MAETIWIESRKWTRHELEGKLVEFNISYPQTRAEGIGVFLVRGNGVERMAIDIVVPEPNEFYDNLFHMTDSLAESIELHPNQAKARYRVSGRIRAVI